jgi:predicted RNA-binding Zn ribbon-like protein
MDALFLASHPALDFLNTSLAPKGVAIELIGDGRSFVDWLVRAGLLTPQDAAKALRQFGSAALDRSAADARKLRDWAGVWIARWRDTSGADCRAELLRLNDLLARASRRRELVLTADGLQLEERFALDAADQLVALVAAQIAELVSMEERALVKRCSGAACTLWFLDRTKAHRRIFCSASVCGNRAKVAAFRQRQRAS